MYKVTINTIGSTKVIHSPSTSLDAPKLSSGSIKKGINTIDSFQFVILPNNPGYAEIVPLLTTIEVLNTKTNTIEFKGRVLLQNERMDGKLYKTVTCESDLGYLMDSLTRFGIYSSSNSVWDYLYTLLLEHNNQMTSEKQFSLGTVEITDKFGITIGYEKTFDFIKTNILDKYPGELRIRYDSNGTRYLDYLNKIGSKKNTVIRLSKNLKTIEQEKDPSTFVTHLIPLGAKINNTEERLTIKSVNNDDDIIRDYDAIASFGIVQDKWIFDDVTLASVLLQKGQAKIQELNKIKKKIKITALDLSLIGLDIDSFEVGNTHTIINPLMAINEDLRIIEKSIDILNPQDSDLTVGDKFETLTEYQSALISANRAIESVNSGLSNSIGSINSELTSTNTTLNKIKIRNIMGV